MPLTAKRMTNTAYLSLLWQEFMMHFVTKAIPSHSIDGKSQIKKWRSYITCLTGYYGLVFGGGTHTCKHAYWLHRSKQFQETKRVRRVPGLKLWGYRKEHSNVQRTGHCHSKTKRAILFLGWKQGGDWQARGELTPYKNNAVAVTL